MYLDCVPVLLLTISNCEKTCCCMNTMCSWHSEVDPAIRRHGEPHVVRVGVDGILTPRFKVEVLFICCGSNLSEEFDILVGAIVTMSTVH